MIDYNDVDYEWIKAYSAQMRQELGPGYRVDDFLAMSQGRDPFYRGTPGDLEKANWFGTVWQKLGLDAITHNGTQVHLRRIHYLLVSRSAEMPPITWGERRNRGRYRNTQEHWQALLDAALNARYLGIVQFRDIHDERNEAPVLYAPPGRPDIPAPQVSVSAGYTYAAHLGMSLLNHWNMPTCTLSGYQYADGGQRYHLEVWVEKSTMEDVLRPVCGLFYANLMQGQGEFSATQMYEAAFRIYRSGRPTRIFYISDYDPAGQNMPVSAGRKLEWFMRAKDSPLRTAFDTYWAQGCDVALTPIALTCEQIVEYGLPTEPAKTSKGKSGKRKATPKTETASTTRWKSDGTTELDALEALHPGVLKRIVRNSLSEFYDGDLKSEVNQMRKLATDRLTEMQEEVLAEYAEQVEILNRDWYTFYERVNPQAEALAERAETLLEGINHAMAKTIEDFDVEDVFPVPEAAEADEDPDAALFWSERSYDEQLEAYHSHQRRDGLTNAA